MWCVSPESLNFWTWLFPSQVKTNRWTWYRISVTFFFLSQILDMVLNYIGSYTSALFIMPKTLTVITTNWKKFLRDGNTKPLTCLLRNLYACQEATVRTGRGTTDWFQVGKGVHLGCILSTYLYNLSNLHLNTHWKDWCWSWNSNTLTTWCKEMTLWKSPWCWKRSKARGEGDNRGWDGWMSSPTEWTWVWASSGSWWWTGNLVSCSPGVANSQIRLRDWNELNWILGFPGG